MLPLVVQEFQERGEFFLNIFDMLWWYNGFLQVNDNTITEINNGMKNVLNEELVNRTDKKSKSLFYVTISHLYKFNLTVMGYVRQLVKSD